MTKDDTDDGETALVPAGSEALLKIEGYLSKAQSKTETIARMMLADLPLVLLRAFAGPLGSIMGDIAGKVEAVRLAEQLGMLEARLGLLEDAELQRAQSDDAMPLVKQMLRFGMEEPDERKKSIYVDAFINAIKNGAPLDSAQFRGMRTLAEMGQRHLDLLRQVGTMQEDAEGMVLLGHVRVDYKSNESRLGEIQELQGWGILVIYTPDTSRQRARVTPFGRQVLGMLAP